MKFIYLTAKKYPGSTADHNYILNMARAFSTELSDFRLVACNTNQNDLLDIPLVNVLVPKFIKRTLVFLFWLPWYWFFKLKKESNDKIVFFSNDQNVLSVLIFWKKVFGFQAIIVADWHLLTNTWKDKFVAKNVDLSIATSCKLQETVSDLAPRKKVKTIYGGVSLKFFENPFNLEEIRCGLSLPQKFLVGYVGLFKTLGKEKGILMMIDSLKYLDQDISMVFVGGKIDEITYYKQYADNKKVGDRCIFVPIQPFDKVVLYEKSMNILSIPYPDQPHFRKFGFPMKIYEYMAAKVPIIYTQLELLEEVVSDCAYGVKPDNAEAFAEKVKEIRSNPEKSLIKTKLSFDKVKGYSWNEKARAVVSAIIQIC